MITTRMSLSQMPCECNTICSIETFSWTILIKENAYYFKISCKTCGKFVESQAATYISLEPESNTASTETNAPPNKKLPITIKEAKENLDKYLASVREEEEELFSPKKEYIH